MARTPQVPGGESKTDAVTTETSEQSPASPPASEGGLPRPEDIDPTKIRRSVLTTAGWICPATSPAPPARQ